MTRRRVTIPLPTAGEAALGLLLAGLAGLPVLRTWALHLGATEAELDAVLPGDDRTPSADLVATRAITVRAPADVVWPWVAQIGADRGGFYSYDALENLVGCGVRSADRVEPAWQTVRVGDAVALHPDLVLRVAVVEPGRALVLEGNAAPGEQQPPYGFTWAFVLRAAPGGGTRLVVRERYVRAGTAAKVVTELASAASTVMSEKMLRGIRDRAERSGAGR
ncbi:SRPBCC family protein [Cellulomonas oligotrophica]|uniref:Polyketide cyclase n=1 Tax=Cellulomonas oligotrophica TaxID=931536 RepID=A0A7Y9FF13_9CELL|nr:SRPBCC family protein [Cellulomonas oligotrophica]NYD86111.1 hypothetical protein [Cellulomonas oligotrophica]GIG30881.1 hypothetical protein Col01nite_00400 [Cellulomonas oligotrophica]